MGIEALYRTTSNNIEEFRFRTKEVDDYFIGGTNLGGANPVMLWFNGSSYAAAYKDNTYNNQIIICRQTKSHIETNEVGIGTSSPEPLNHPAPTLYIDTDGYIYLFQNKYHSDVFRYWKSDFPENISNFTFQGEFSNAASYLGTLNVVGDDITFLTRAGGVSTYSQSVISLNLSTGVNSTLRLTDNTFATSNQRHYTLLPKIYGTPTKRVAGIQHRDETSGLVYKVSLWVSSDYENIENIGGTFSKNVPVAGLITEAELDANYNLVGSEAVRDEQLSTNWLLQINNDIYTAYFDRDVSKFMMSKFVVGTTGAVSSIELNITIAKDYIYYNGENIVVTGRYGNDVYPAVYSISLDLQTVQLERTFPEFETGLYWGMPANLDEVDGEYMLLGRSDTSVSPTGTMPYMLTQNKFII